MYRVLFVAFFVSLALRSATLFASPPPGYYDLAEGKMGEELLQALAELTGGHTRISYSWPPFYTLDQDPAEPNNVILIYSSYSVPHDSHHLSWNREHIWPRSRGLGNSGTAHDDLHNLVPINPGVNSARGNLPFGYPDPEHPNYRPPGHYEQAPLASRDSRRWLPPEFDRGFLARAVAYMAVRYNGDGTEPNLILTNNPPEESPWGFEMGERNVLIRWNRKHRPSEYELRRNRLIFEQYQHNRNPFIDFPELMDAAFGTPNMPGYWKVERFTFAELGDPTITDWFAEPDGDGCSNLFKYAFGLPRNYDASNPVTIEHLGTQLRLTFPYLVDAREFGIAYGIEVSTDLVEWESRWFPKFIAQPNTPDLGDTDTIGTFQTHTSATVFIPIEDTTFIRVRVTME